jgi:hypothetical protein
LARRAPFGSAHEAIGDAAPRALLEHRRRMYERHLGWPIEI